MSRKYEMLLSVANVQSVDEAVKIVRMFEEHFGNTNDGDYPNNYPGEMSVFAIGHLVGGETEEQFHERICHLVWIILGRYEEVQLQATCLEELPCEMHVSSKRMFNRFASLAMLPFDMQEENGEKK